MHTEGPSATVATIHTVDAHTQDVPGFIGHCHFHAAYLCIVTLL